MKPRAIAGSRTRRLLELDTILQKLERAACELGRARVASLVAAGDAAEVRRRLLETSQTRQFLDSGFKATFGGITDIGPQLKRATIGSMLEPSDLVAVGRFAAGARRLQQAIKAAPSMEYSVLHRHASAITPRADLEKAINDAIDDDSGEVKDDASLELLRARRGIRQTQNNIQSKLRDMLSDSRVQPYLQDAFVTVRDGRYCVPVKAESRGQVPGIVHDRSGSGGAFFIEPQAVVDLNNRLRELISEEREAVRQILTQLTAHVAGAADDLGAALKACGDLDFAFAKARLSIEMRGCEPLIEELCDTRPASEGDGRDQKAAGGCGWALLQARHPLIEDPIPNDILLGGGSDAITGQEFDVMLITGPNTGGKTVVLKTLGLLTLMAACGLHLPVDSGSRLCIPGQVFADIGDEQSIEQSLSTFSSHMKQIVHILKHAQSGDLVLLDEVGAGTDPDEGASLAKAVLRALQRRGVRVVATTHYGELKQFALGSERFKNASVEFDARSLRPTYHLRIGVPGASNALDIAARLGLPGELVQRARRYLGRERVEAEAATQRLEETQRELEEKSESTQRERDEARRLREQYEARLAKLERELAVEREKAQREARTIVRQAQEEADAVLRDLRRAAKESKQTEVARGRLRTLRERVDSRNESDEKRERGREEEKLPETATNESSVEIAKISPPRLLAPRALKEGDAVRVRSLNKEGVLLSEPDGSRRVEVRVGAIKVQVPLEDIEAVAQQTEKKIGGVSAIRIRKAVTVEDEINLIGKTTDEALLELEKYMDDAILADADQVRIVHGKGSGALRNAIHRWLKNERAVREYSLAPPQEGGEGATIVQLGPEKKIGGRQVVEAAD